VKVLKTGIAALGVVGLSACVSQPTLWGTKDFKRTPGTDTLAYEIGNFSSGQLKNIKGNVSVYVDDQLMSTKPLKEIVDANPTLRTPRNVSLIDTGIKLTGAERKVLVKLSGVEDANFIRKFRTQTLDFSKPVSEDVQVADVTLSPTDGISRTLKVTLKNNGNTIASAKRKVRLEINGQPVPDGNPLEVQMTNVARGGTAQGLITLISPLIPANFVNLKATIVEMDEDIANNSLAKIQASDSAIDAKYSSLLNDPIIARNLIWIPTLNENPCPYTAWTPAMKNDLNGFLRKLERGESIDNLANRPSPFMYTADKAWSTYLGFVAQSLWVEANKKVEWSLLDYTDDNLKLLLDARSWLKAVNAGNGVVKYQLWITRGGHVENTDAKMNYNFMMNAGLLYPARGLTILGVTNWLRGHGDHFLAGVAPRNAPANMPSDEKARRAQWGSAGHPSMHDTLYPKVRSYVLTAASGQVADKTIKNVIVEGCSGAVGIYKALLASVNIPVKATVSFIDTPTMNTTTNELVGHNTPFFPTEDWTLTHGDDPYMMMNNAVDPVIPSMSADKFHLTTPQITSMLTNCLGSADEAACKTKNKRERTKYIVSQLVSTGSWVYMKSYANTGNEQALVDHFRNVDGLSDLFTEQEARNMAAQVRSATLDYGKKLGGNSDADKRAKVYAELDARWKEHFNLK